MRGTYIMLAAVWCALGCCVVIAWTARRRIKKLEKLIAEERQRKNGQRNTPQKTESYNG